MPLRFLPFLAKRTLPGRPEFPRGRQRHGPGGLSPHVALLAGLPAEKQYAAVELSRGTKVCDSALAYGNDEPADVHSIHFNGDVWLRYLTLRLPGTLCVEERLPPGVAGVLINPRHTYTDIYLPIDAEKKRILDAIDGQRSIGRIAGGHQAQGSKARTILGR